MSQATLPATTADAIRTLADQTDDNISEATAAAYRTDFAHWTAWAQDREGAALPADPDQVADYLAHLAEDGLKHATCQRRAAAIRWAHRTAGHPDPCSATVVRNTLTAIKDTLGGPETTRAVTVDHLHRMVASCQVDTLIGTRDACLLTLGWATAMRRDELAQLDLADLTIDDTQLVIDQPRQLTITTGPAGIDPISHLTRWLTLAELESGPVLRPVGRDNTVGALGLSGRSITRAIQRCAARADLSVHYSGQSLRDGAIIHMLAHGTPVAEVATHAGLAPTSKRLAAHVETASRR